MDKPKKIYLQIEYDGEPTEEWTWCVDRINDSDIEYVVCTPALREFLVQLTFFNRGGEIK